MYDRTSKKALQGASVHINGRDFLATTSTFGDFWRVLTPGSYKVTAQAKGYQPKNFEIKVDESMAPTEITFSLDRKGVIRVSGVVFLALIISCFFVFILMLFLLSRVCHWQKRGKRRYGKDGFLPLPGIDDDEKPKYKSGGKIGGNAVILEESEISDDDEEEVLFSDTELGIAKF